MNFYKNNRTFIITLIVLIIVALTAQYLQPKPDIAPGVETPGATTDDGQ